MLLFFYVKIHRLYNQISSAEFAMMNTFNITTPLPIQVLNKKKVGTSQENNNKKDTSTL